MLSPRWQKVRRDLWGYKTRTALVVLSIAAGIFAIGLVISSRTVLARDLSGGYIAISPASTTFFTDPFDEELLAVIRRMPEVRAAEGRHRVTARLQGGDEAAWYTVQLIAIDDYDAIGINQLHPQAGAWPPPERELLLERSALSLLSARLGDPLVIELPDGQQRELRLAGLVHDLSQLPSFFTDAAVGYISFDTLEWLGEPRSYNELTIAMSGSGHPKTHAEQVAALVRSKLEKGGRTVYQTLVVEPDVYPLDDMIQALLIILGTLGGMSLFLSVFLVLNTVTAILTQQVRQIGIMKAIGARRAQITAMYLSMVLLFGLLAFSIAVPLGALGARTLTRYIAALLNFDLATSGLSLSVLVIELLIALVAPVVAALWPILAGTRVTVQAALNDYGISGGGFGESWLDRLVGRLRGLPRPLLLSLRNTVRRKSRFGLTLATLSLAGATVMAVLSVRASTYQTIDETMSSWNYDVEVTFRQPYRLKRIEHEAVHLPGVVAVEGWLVKGGVRVRDDGAEGGNLAVTGLPATTTRFRPTLRAGRWLYPGETQAAVVDTSVLKAEPDLAVGHPLTITIEGRETVWQVVGIITGQMMGPAIYVEDAALARQLREVGRTNHLVVTTNAHDGSAQTAILNQLEQRFKAAGLRVTTTRTMTDLRALTLAHYTVVIVLLLVMALALGIVGGVGLMGTMSLNVLERTREFGVMRSIGASNGAVRQIVIVEGVLIGLLSWLFGVLLALPLSRGLNDAVGIATLNVPLSYRFSTSGALLWLLVVILLSALASFLPAWQASRLTVREVLAYE